MKEATPADIAKRLQDARNAVMRDGHGPRCALVVGAGCSVTAGVPTAGEFVKVFQEEFPNNKGLESAKGYLEALEHLSVTERRAVIRKECAKANRLNSAHLAMAYLLREGFVRYILTTNFDPLVMESCRRLEADHSPYGFTDLASGYYPFGQAEEPAVIHLHGQHTSVVQINTPGEFKKNGRVLAKLFESLNNHCIWIVAGFSGKDNPTILTLLRMRQIKHWLYWVQYPEDPWDEQVEHALAKHEAALRVPGFDADAFFLSLVAGVGGDTSQILAQKDAPIRGGRPITSGPQAPAAFPPEERLRVPDPLPGLILNLPRFNKKGYEGVAQLVESRANADWRGRALWSNWGPLIVAVQHHAEALRHCWIVCSPQVRDDFVHAEKLIVALAPGARCYPIYLVNENSILDVQEKVKAIYNTLGPEARLRQEQIMADITGGNSTMTGGMVLATLDDKRAIEYLRQGQPISKPDGPDAFQALTPEEIREQQVLIGIHTVGAMVRDVVLRAGG